MTLEIQEAICTEIATGSSMKEAYEKHGLKKHEFYNLLWKDESFATSVARARERQQEALVDSMREIADAATPEDWQVARLRIWQRQWEAGKLAPKKYGDKLQHANSAGDGDPVVTIKLESPLPPIKVDA